MSLIMLGKSFPFYSQLCAKKSMQLIQKLLFIVIYLNINRVSIIHYIIKYLKVPFYLKCFLKQSKNDLPKLFIQIKNSIYNTFIMGFVIILHIVLYMPFNNMAKIQSQNKWIRKLVYILQICIFKSCAIILNHENI